MKITAPVVLGLLVLGAACNLDTRYFKDYDGVNLIASLDLNAVDAITTAPYWISMTDVSGTDPYMNFSADATVPGPTGISNPVYRLELKNLLPNGDFSAGLSGYWTPQNLTATPKISLQIFDADQTAGSGTKVVDDPGNGFALNGSNPRPISGNSLFFFAGSANDQLYFDLDQALGSTNYVPGRYLLHLDFKTAQTLYAQYYEYDNTTNYSNRQSWAVGANLTTGLQLSDDYQTTSTMPNNTGRANVLGFGVTTLTNRHRFSIGMEAAVGDPISGSPQALVLDNVKILRTDVDHSIEFKIFSLSTAQPKLLPGKYKFYLWVKDDPSVGTPGGANRFAADYLTVQVLAATKTKATGTDIVAQAIVPRGGNRPINQTESISTVALGQWSAWTRVAVTVPNVIDFLDEDPPVTVPATPVLTIRISPNQDFLTDASRWTPGSVMICQPWLQFFEK